MQSDGAPRQLSLDFGPLPGNRKGSLDHSDALYFAVLPDPATAASLARLADELRIGHGLSGRARAMELFHLSLNAIGAFHDLPPEIVSAARTVGAGDEAAPFTVTLDRVMSFKGGDPLPLVARCGEGIAALAALYKALGAGLKQAGLASGARSRFIPHVTLLYDRVSLPPTPIDAPIHWTVRDFVLVHSLHGLGRHLHLARWPLRGGRREAAPTSQ